MQSILHFFFGLTIFLSSCDAMEQNKESQEPNVDTREEWKGDPNYSFKYTLSQPVKTYVLPEKLTEVSGIAFTEKKELACVQDEKGNIYIFNEQTEEVERKIDFGKNGDYEGIAYKGNTAFVLRNDGNIYEVKNVDTDKQETIVHKTSLGKSNDTEGLCYDKLNNRLLIACKGHGGKGEPFIEKKSVYSFNLKTMKLEAKPAFNISLNQLKKFIKRNQLLERYEDLKSFFDPAKAHTLFQPSEIGIHPITGNIYLLASVGKLLIILNPKGNILHFERLDKALLKQPEGLAFYENGDMLIASEGKKSKGKILKFQYQAQ